MTNESYQFLKIYNTVFLVLQREFEKELTVLQPLRLRKQMKYNFIYK